jgi:hypothetical protein
VVLEDEPEPVVPEVPEPEVDELEPPGVVLGLVVLDPELPMPEVVLLDEPMPELLVLLPGVVVVVLALGAGEEPPLDVRVLEVDWQPAASAAAATMAARDKMRGDVMVAFPSKR